MAAAKKQTGSPLGPLNSRIANRFRHVACWSGFAPVIWKGVLDYVTKHQNWRVQQLWELSDAEWQTWKGDGILLKGDRTDGDKLARQLRVPVVVVEPSQSLPAFSWVGDDNLAVGKMAAEHLLERGLNQFGFLGAAGYVYSDERRDGFVQRLQQAGFTCSEYANTAIPVGKPQVESIARWLVGLQKPAGIMTAAPFYAYQLLAACNRQELLVPEDVAIITTKWASDADQPELLPLTFVKLNDQALGMEAAALLDRLMSGTREAPGTAHRISPLGVETRQSTNLLAIPDPQVVLALRYIWKHACEGIGVEDVLKLGKTSRRGLEWRFQRWVGRTLHQEIVRVRIKRAKELLAGTHLTAKQIAEQTGYDFASNFGVSFRRETGMTPRKYRALQTAD